VDERLNDSKPEYSKIPYVPKKSAGMGCVLQRTRDRLLFPRLFESGPMAFMELSPEPDFPVIYASPNWAEMLGRPLPTNGLDHFAEVVMGEDRQRVLAEIDTLTQADSAPQRVEHAPFRVCTHQGEELWLQGTSISFEGGSPNDPPAYFICCTNVTDYITTQKCLTLSQEQHSRLNQLVRLMADNMPDMLWAKDMENRYIFTNRVMCANLLQASDTSEPIGKTDMFFAERERNAHPENPQWHTFGEMCANSDETVRNSGRPERFDECGNVRGKFIFLDVHKAPIFDNDGEIIGTVGCGRDVTREKELEHRIKRWASVFESTLEGIILTDAETHIVDANPAFTQITGYTRDEILGKRPSMLQSGKHDELFYRRMWRSIKDTGSWQGEVWNKHKDGEVYPEWLAISTIKSDRGEVANYIGMFADISEAKHTQEKLNHLAHYDPLTGLYNRHMFTLRLEYSLQRAKRTGEQLALLFLDLDHFKVINDTLGHPAGDALLMEVAGRIKDCLREVDTVARLAGDEFIIIIEKASQIDSLETIANKVLDVLRQPIGVEGHQFHSTASIGIARYPEDGEDEHTLIKNADAAMYLAKEKGRNTLAFYTGELEEQAFRRLTVGEGLPTAIAENQLVVHYQPQISLESGLFIGVEALVRWNHPTEGLLLPDHFLPIAESTGQIVEVDAWVLRKACAQLKTWQNHEFPFLRVAVNLSASDFVDGNLISTVTGALDATGLDPSCLELEITETALMYRLQHTADVLKELREMGCHIAIDDFGTGYSSLSYLSTLPVDKLKIDRSFVRNIPMVSNSTAIPRAVIVLGQELGLSILAEGVETNEQEDFLKAEGCEEAQGFRYGKPMPAEDIEKACVV